MRTRTYTKPHAVWLMSELVAAIPTFLRTAPDPRGGREALPDCGSVVSNGNVVTVIFADDIDPAAVDAVVAAHDPNAPRPRTPREEGLADIRAIIADPNTPAPTRRILQAMLKVWEGP